MAQKSNFKKNDSSLRFELQQTVDTSPDDIRLPRRDRNSKEYGSHRHRINAERPHDGGHRQQVRVEEQRRVQQHRQRQRQQSEKQIA